MLHVYKFCKSIFRGRPLCNIHRIVLGVRNKSRQETLPRTHQQSVHGRVEMDSHADTTVLGSKCVVLAYTGKECEVSPYADEYDAIRNIPVVAGATVWTNSQDGVPILLVFNEALWMGDRLHHTLINPNQLRSYGVDVQDNPFAKEDLTIIMDDYIIPLDTQGTTIFFDMRSPTEVELQQIPRVILTSVIDWDPQKVQFPSHNSDRVVSNTFVQTTSNFCLHKTTYDLEHFSSRIIQQIQVDWPEGEQNPTIRQDIPSARTFQSREHHSGITLADISERWYIGMSQANTTLNTTTQRLVRSALLPLSRQYRADRMYERPHIHGTIYTDTMGGRHKSLDGNKYTQVFANDSFFAVSYPMDKESSAGQALKQFIADFGVPDRIVCDGSGEQMGKRTEFTVTARKHGIDIHLTEPDRHNQSKVEGVICKLRKRWFRVMLKQRVQTAYGTMASAGCAKLCNALHQIQSVSTAGHLWNNSRVKLLTYLNI